MDATSTIIAILSIGILIMLHEAGHFWVARRSGMRVRRFSIGFGPRLLAFQRGETEYCISAIPFGGYVQIDGLNPHDNTDPNASDSYASKPVHLRIATILAGPAANYLIGFILLFVFYAFFFTEALAPVRVVRVVEGGAAAAAGLQKDDLIVGTSSATFERADEMIAAIQSSAGGSLPLRVRRGDRELPLVITPKLDGGAYRIGVEFEATRFVERPKGVGEGAVEAWNRVWRSSGAILSALAGLFKPGGSERLSGPIGMVKSLSRSVDASFTQALAFVGDISVMLGLGNLLPIPALDGSRLLFLIVGIVRRKPIAPKVEAVVHAVGFVLLILLLVIVSIGDVTR